MHCLFIFFHFLNDVFIRKKLILLLLVFIGCQSGENSYQTWEVYKGDATSSSYSELDHINKHNVNRLEVAWIHRTGDLGEYHPRTGIETNSIIVNDILYAASAHLKIFAADAATGEELWSFDPFKGSRVVDKLRGVVYWGDGINRRILFTAGNWLYALDAETGEGLKEFGTEGRVSLNAGLDRDPEAISVTASSPGIIYEDLLILGSTVGKNTPVPAPGYIRAYDVRTGDIVWTFHTIPQPGEPGFETWGLDEESLDRRAGANSWAGMSLDKDRGIVYAPVGAPVYDWHGGNRPGKNLYANSLLALDAATGERMWHYQIVHHDLWDYDLPAPPNLLTVEKDGQAVDVVAQITKHGFTFVFNRETGEPVFPIEEKPVPQSNIGAETPWPTQPFPAKPEPFARQYLTPEEVTDLSPEAREYVLAELEQYRNEGLFTPGDPKGSIMLPGTTGAGRWGGAAHDPESGILYVNSSEIPSILTVRWQADRSSSPGEAFYVRNCAACHGMNREGQPPDFPSLTAIKETSSKQEVLEIIEEGASMMPAFPTISEEEQTAILAYLFEEESGEQENASFMEGDPGYGQYIGVNPHRRFVDQDGYPAIKPPWGSLNAIDLNTGEMKWKVPLGTYPELIEQGIPPTGTPSMGGPVVTAGGLIFIGGTEDQKFRAFDKDNGELLWETTLPAAGFATPSTYMSGGRQYVVIAAGGGRGTDPGDYYVAFALPE